MALDCDQEYAIVISVLIVNIPKYIGRDKKTLAYNWRSIGLTM
jgi:hypothetical protein